MRRTRLLSTIKGTSLLGKAMLGATLVLTAGGGVAAAASGGSTDRPSTPSSVSVDRSGLDGGGDDGTADQGRGDVGRP
ncbi:MAG: hypothetical protein QOJ49_288, partial [Actinomycetota bacterium]|nr:hypothetical protein [Actinomycetota bacterium]